MKTVEKVFEALKNEGLVPVMENFGISFKFQMTNYVYMEDENDVLLEEQCTCRRRIHC